MEFRVLGPLEVLAGGRAVAVGGHRQQKLLVALLVAAERVVSVDALAAGLWGEHPPADPRNAIQTAVARLRQALGPDLPLETRHPGYRLDVGAGQVDALRFDELLDATWRRRPDPTEARRILEEALALWRGPAFAGFSDDVAQAAALRLEERRLVAREELFSARLALGEARDLVGELEAEVAVNPHRSRLAELCMRALAASDRPGEALAVYRTHRNRLVEDTGLEPSAAVRALERVILRGELEGDVAPQTARRDSRSTAVAVAVPLARTSLIGRHAEVAAVRAALARSRLVTLTGTGGVGKSRIAGEVLRAEDVGPADRRGAALERAWIELAEVTDADAVEHVLAAALGIDLQGDRTPRRALLDALTDRRLLLAIDNVEHLIDPVASLVDEIQHRCPQVSVLATSRERLAVDGEVVVGVEPLDTDTEDGPAVELFLERARGAPRDPDLDARRHVVADICRELDGLPLAIELAAARTAVLTVEELLAALREDVPAIVGSRRGRGRHRDLWAVVDWSYRLLDGDSRRLFERLGIFAGTFALDDVHAICAPGDWSRGHTADRLVALVEQSLVAFPAGSSVEGSGRYRLLRPLHVFARQRLADGGELAPLADRHAAVLVARAERAAGPPLTETGRRWLEASLDDLRAVRLRVRLTGDGRLLARLVAALYRFDYWRPGCELLSWADGALELDGVADGPKGPQVCAAASAAAWTRGDLERARRLAEQGIELRGAGDVAARAIAYEAFGDVANFAGRLPDAEAAFREEARLARIAGDPDAEAVGLASAAIVLAYSGRSEEAVDQADAAAGPAQAAGPGARAFVRYAQGECRADLEPDRAVGYVEEAAELASAANAWFVEGVARVTAVSLRARYGSAGDALPAFSELIRHWHRSGSWIQQWTTLRNLAVLLVGLEISEPAVVIAGASRAEAERSAFGAELRRLEEALSVARRDLGDRRYDDAHRRGAQLRPGDVVELALETIEHSSPSRRE